MRVLIISEHYFPILGGSTTYVHNLCKNLANIGCEVFLVTIPGDEKPVLSWYRDDGFNVYRLRIPRFLRKERYFPIFLQMRLNSILNDVEPDVIHFAHGFFAPLVTKLDKRIKEKPIVWTIQNIPPYEHSLNMSRDVRFIQRILESSYKTLADIYGRFALKVSKFDCLICVSENTGKLALERNVPKNKVIVLPNGVDTNFFASRNDKAKIRDDLGFQKYKKIVLTVSGVIPHKGLDYLIKSIPKVLEKHPNTLFLVIGPVRSSNFFQLLKTLINDLKAADNVKIMQGVDFTEINKYYAVSDVYVLPSLEEGRNISVLEAMSSGLPVVGTESALRFNNDVPCIKIGERDATQIAKAVNKLLDDVQYARQMGQQARNYILKKFSWDKVAKETMEVYEGLVEKNTY